jgi:tRNA nucleotidyltransferase (CCA-adding enzyme)
MADDILLRLKSPTALREEVVFLVAHHMDRPEAEKKLLRRRMSRWGEDRLQQLLLLQKADLSSKGVPAEPFPYGQIRELLEQLKEENSCLTLRDLAINGHDLMALGITGKLVGETLNHLLNQVLNEEIPNEKAALLAEVRSNKL